MQNRSTNKWLDVQIVIATLAMTFILGLWNLFSRESVSISSVTEVEPIPQQVPAVNNPPPPSQTRVLLGGPAPQQVQPSSSVFVPAPVTSTRSSRP